MPAFRSRLSCARARADLVGALERVHPLGERALRRRRRGLVASVRGAAAWAASIQAQRAVEQAKSHEIHLDLDLSLMRLQRGSSVFPAFAGAFHADDGAARRRSGEWTRGVCEPVRASSRAIRDPPAGVAEALGADRDQRRAGAQQIERVRGRVWTPPMPTIGTLTRRRDRRDLRQRDAARPPGPDSPPVPPAEPRLAGRAGRAPSPRSVLISDTRVGAGRLGGRGARGRRRRRSASASTISGLAVSGRTRVDGARDLGRVRAR